MPPLSRIAETARFDPQAHADLVAWIATFHGIAELLSPKLMHLIWIGVDVVVTHYRPEQLQGAVGQKLLQV